MYSLSYYNRIVLFTILYLFLVPFFQSCTNSPKDDFADCKYKKPEAIFSSQIPNVTKHQFDVRQKEGIEEVQFVNGMRLELIQSGCNTITQDFQFSIPGQFDSAAPPIFWIEKAIEQLMYLGSLNENYAAFTFWAQAIQGKKTAFQLGESIHLQEGYFAEINKVPGTDYAIITLKLFENNRAE